MKRGKLAEVIDLDAYRPGWRVQPEKCLSCGAEWIAVKHPAAPLHGCECPRCHRMSGEAVAPT